MRQAGRQRAISDILSICCVSRYLLDDDEEEWAFNNDSTLTVGRNY